MNQSYGDDVFDGVCEVIDGGTVPFIVVVLIASFVVGFFAGKSVGRQELLQEFNKTGWYYDERSKEFWRRGEK